MKQSQLDGLKVEIQRGQAVEQKHQEFLTLKQAALSKLSTLKIILRRRADRSVTSAGAGECGGFNLLIQFQPLPVSQRISFRMAHQFRGRWILPPPEPSLTNSASSRIVNVSDVKIVESKKPGRTISTTCVATTFVYNEEKDNAEIQKALAAKKK